MKNAVNELIAKGKAAKEASRKLGYISTEIKNQALQNIAVALRANTREILAANKLDLKAASANGINETMQDRLLLHEARLEAMAKDVLSIAALPDPVGEMFDTRTLPNGLLLGKKRVPLGVIGAMYESRPNVTIDISALCLKSGNAVILRGGKEAFHSNLALASLVLAASDKAGIPPGAVQFVDNTDRALVNEMLQLSDYIDLMIPRGGESFVKFVAQNAKMGVVAGGIGVCHTYVDASADIDKAVNIVFNAKVQKPSVCNALDTILVHKAIAEDYLPLVARRLAAAGVEMHCDKASLAILKPIKGLKLKAAVKADWGKEFLALIAAIKIVASLDEALAHIAIYGSGHSEAIITEDYTSAMRFLNEMDAACVYVNASTRFTDGGQFGLGAEVGISTQKMHARGPLGLKELTSYKWIIFGNGQVRP
jgi:glutamate-5-semialdehyde dehydrogenase